MIKVNNWANFNSMDSIADEVELLSEMCKYLSHKNITLGNEYFYHFSINASDSNFACNNSKHSIERYDDYFDEEFIQDAFSKPNIKFKRFNKPCNYYRIIDELQMDIYDDNVNYHIHKITNWELFEDGMKSSVYSVVLLDYWFDENRYDRIDELMENLHIQVLTEWSIVALLRTTYSAKHLLSSWEPFYLKAQQHLNHITPKHAKKLLMGLDR